MTDIVVKKKKNNNDSTHLALMISSTSQEDLTSFDINRIINSLIAEHNMVIEDATKVANLAFTKIQSLYQTSKKPISTTLIRDIVRSSLYELGYNEEFNSQKEYTIPHNDITQIIENANTENGNTEHNPESINLTLAGMASKDYALKNVFSKDIVKSHLEGKLHLHDLDFITRAYCSGHSIDYVKKFGITNIPNIMSTSKPANSAETLARHICSMTQFFTSLFAGAIGWEGVNIFFAPLLRNKTKKELKQLAQTLIYDLSQLAGAKGGQTSFTDFNCYITIPNHYRETYAMFEGGKFAVSANDGSFMKFFDTRQECDTYMNDGNKKGFYIHKYKHYEKEAQKFLYEILDVIKEGDASGLPFAFPKINLHINEDTFILDGKENEEGIKLLEKACESSAKSGCPYFIFDRNAMSISQCCRLSIQFSEEDQKLTETPEELRFVGVQNVSINLPNCALHTKGNEEKFFKELESRMRLAMKAHIQKVKYLEHLMSLKNSPLKFYNRGMDGKPYVNLKKGSYLIGIVGLNECVYNLIGKQLHEDNDAHKKGLQIIIFMNKITKILSEEFGLTVKLEETPAESTSARFALLDKRKYPDAFVKQNDKGTYYTNSIHFAYDCNMDYVDRLLKQSSYHFFVEAGSMIHLWCGDRLPTPKAIFNLVKKTWYETKCAQWVLSPEYTVCSDCNKTTVGFFEKCPRCESESVNQVTRVTGYYIITSKANKGKKAEIQDRNHETYILKEEYL